MSEIHPTWLQRMFGGRTVRAMERAFERGAQHAPCTRQLQRGLRGLSFDEPELEGEFRRRYTDLNIGRIRAAIWLSIGLVGLVATLDLLTAPAAIRTSVFIEKLLFLLPIPLFTLWVSYHPRHYRQVRHAMKLAIVSAGIVLSGIHTQAGLAGYTLPYDAMLLLVVYSYFLSALLWPSVVLVSLAVSVLTIGSDLVVGVDANVLAYHALHLIAVNLIGIVGSFMLERVSRLDYLHAGSASEMADIDRVTSLRSAASFERRLERWWRKAQQRHSPLGLMLVDVDYFRRFDQSCGHYAAESALRNIAQAIQGLRSSQECFLAHLDDDGFAVIMRDASVPALTQLASEIREAVGNLHLQHPDSPIASELTVSIAGRVTQPRDGQSCGLFATTVRADLERLKRCNRNSIWIEPGEDFLPPEPSEKVTPLRRQG